MAAEDNSCFWLADFLKSSPLKPLSQMNRNMVGTIYGRSSIKIAYFVPIRWQTWSPQGILVSDWLILKKSSLKPFVEMNRNLVGSIYGRPSNKIAHFVPICSQTLPPQTMLVSDWSIYKNFLLWNCLSKWTAIW